MCSRREWTDKEAIRLSLPARACNDDGPGGVCTWCDELHTVTISATPEPGPWIDRGRLRDNSDYCTDRGCDLCDRRVTQAI